MSKVEKNGARKVLVIGWDGATFDIVRPLVEQGRLPHVAFLMQNGAWGRMESATLPLTPVAWTSISTGVNPGKHGIYDAMFYLPGEHKIGFVSATKRKAKPIWLILSERGFRVGVMNVPVTYPPDEVNGFVIPGMFTPEGVGDFIYPSELQTEIEKEFGKYMIECKQVDNPSAYLRSILDMVALREKVALYLMDNYSLDFFFVTFIASDRVQHFYWKYLDPCHPEHHRHGESIALVYERMDQALGRLLKKAEPGTNVVIVSDHGSGPLTSAFFLNNWLMKNGFLYLKEDPANALKISRFSLARSNIAKSIKKLIPSALWDKMKAAGIGAHQEQLNLFLSIIDWDRTRAFSEGVGGGIYINSDIVKPEQYEVLLGQISQGLSDVTDPYGKKVVKVVYRREELYSGDYILEAPDLTVICNEEYQIIAPNEFLYFNKQFEDTLFLPHRWSARHEQHGIFLLSGPAIEKKTEIKDSRIIDISPTVLYLMNEAIPRYMDGKVLEKAIVQEYFLKNPIRYIADTIQQERAGTGLSEGEEKEIVGMLKNLGYME